ncbi:ASB5, partial [Symbiodinium sp. KB8]
MLRRKLNFLLARGEFHDYRMLLNSQRLHLRGLPIDRMVDLIPGFVSDQQDPAAHDLALFMHLNGFQE